MLTTIKNLPPWLVLLVSLLLSNEILDASEISASTLTTATQPATTSGTRLYLTE